MSGTALFWTLLAQVAGGITPVITKRALSALDPWTLVAARQVAGLAMVALVFAVLRRRRAQPAFSDRDWGLLACMAWLGFALPMLLLAIGIERSTAIHGALLAPVEPIAILIGGAIFFRERVTLARATAFVLGALGTTAIVVSTPATPGTTDRIGDLAILFGYLAWAVYTLAGKPLVERHSAERVTLAAVALSTPPLLFFAAAEPPERVPQVSELGWIAALAFVGTALAPFAWNRALQSISAGTMAAFIFVQPLVGWAAGVLWLGETWEAPALGGAALVVAGVTLAALRSGSAAAPRAPRAAAGDIDDELAALENAESRPVSSAAAREMAFLLVRQSPREPPAADLEPADAPAPVADAPATVPIEDPALRATAPTAAAAPEAAAPAEREAAAPRMDEPFLTLHQIVRAAHDHLPPELWHHLIGGADTEATVQRNRRALDSLALRPRVLRDVSHVDPSTAMFGRRLRIPVFLAPIGGAESLHPEGSLASARAAAGFGTACLQSSQCLPEIEITADVVGAPRIFQLHVRGDTSWIDAQVERAIAAGCMAFCLTVDGALPSRRERDLVTHLETPWRQRPLGADFEAALSWKYIEHYKQRFSLPLVLKGIATAADAVLACQHGVDAVYVSNHGGRQLDHGRGSVQLLSEVVDAVADRAQVWVDGGFCRGTDVVKAIALGARLVGIGRLQGYGVAAAGETGVTRVLELLEAEIRLALGLLGVARLEELDRSYIERTEPLGAAHVLSAFPLLPPNLHTPPTQ
jgi:isopentenyl diphosphate isomerase/L-lactate dehydrogenase-like FMN-dependent dehydrogenase/drug/metabolite transporter (DMT)-like permease